VLDLDQLQDARSLAVSVKAGAPAAHYDAVTAAAENQTVELYQGEDVEIKVVRLKEGGQGFYFQVVCIDNARLPDGGTDEYANKIYYYDNESGDGMYVLDRCVLDDAAAQESDSLFPSTKFSVVPSAAAFVSRRLQDGRAPPWPWTPASRRSTAVS